LVWKKIKFGYEVKEHTSKMVFVNKRNTTHGGLTYVLYELEISIRIKKN